MNVIAAMVLRSRFCAAAVAILCIAGCSHGTVSQLPTAPSPPPIAVTIQRLTITKVVGTLRIGNEFPITTSGPVTGSSFGAVAQYNDGSARHVDATWTSDNDSAIRIEGGNFKAVAGGSATITARAEGMTATETFTVEPGIAGSWSGSVVVDNCQAGSGSLNEMLCFPRDQGRTPGMLHPGAAQPLSLTIAKGAGDALTATAQVGDLRGTLTGTDRGVNFMTLKGDLTGNGVTLTLVHWDTQARGDSLEGFIGFEMRIAGVPSHAIVTAHLANVTRR